MMKINYNIPRVFIGSHKGGAGKTIISTGLALSFQKRGYQVSVFKKGPDYIDAGWLGCLSGTKCRNLDLFLFEDVYNLYSFYQASKGMDIAIVEGNRGLFDGIDVFGSFSSASLARLLKSPIILVLDCSKVTRSLAALVKGFVEFEKGLEIEGVILNRIARPRHESIIRSSIEYYTGIPVLGAIPKLRNLPEERHLGLITFFEYPSTRFFEELVKVIETSVDLDRIFEIAKKVKELEVPDNLINFMPKYKDIKIGVFRDLAFQFYYCENLEALENLGAELVYINSLEERRLPEVDALYIGGGFPEVYAERLSENMDLLKETKERIERGLPVYAECGGLMVLGEEINWKERKYPMMGLLPIKFKVEKNPQGHGYVIARVTRDNPFYEKGGFIKGHEFHYSIPVEVGEKEGMNFVLELEKGFGFDGKRDGISYKNLLATYTHIHIYSVKCWAEKFLKKAEEHKQQKINLKEV